MSLISQVIPALTNGVSQQPPAYRSPSQAGESVNFDMTVSGGLQKRLPTVIMRQLTSLYLTKAFIHFVDNPGGRFFMVFTGVDASPTNYPSTLGPSIRVFDISGNEQSFPHLWSDAAYFATPNPQEDLRAVTIGDYTIVVNRLKRIEYADTGLTNTYQEVQNFAALPAPTAVTPVNYYKVLGDQSNGFGSYWVTRGGTGGNSAWVETSIPAFNNYIIRETLPRWVYRDPATGVWAFRPLNDTWKGRLVGDKFLSPLPSIAGKTIQDVFFYRNRLGFLTSDTVVMSRSGDPTNFFPYTMTAVRDDDPIDFALAFPKSSPLRHAVPFNRSLILFADRGQYVINAEGILSPRTVRAEILTEFEASKGVRPVVMGPNLYFCQPQGVGTAVREMYVGQDSIIIDATDVTAACPSYLPPVPTEMRASSINDVLVLKSAASTSLYVFRSKWDKDKRLQQAWFRWELGSRFLLGMEFVDSYLYFVFSTTSGITLERMDFSALGTPRPSNFQLYGGSSEKRWPVSLDRLQVAGGQVYDSETDTSLITLEVPIPVSDPVEVVQAFGDDSGSRWEVIDRPSPTQVRIKGQRTDGFLWYVGVPYSARYTLSPIFVRSEQGTPRLNGRLQLRRMRVCMVDSSYLRVEVTPFKRETITRTFLAPLEGGPFGAIRMADHSLDLALQTDASTAKIELVNDTPYPSRIYAIEWTGYYHNRNRSS